MSNPDFGALLNKAPTEIERPKPLPQGSYTCVVQGMPKFDKSTKKQTPYVEFSLKVLAAGDDVDQEALAAMGGISDKVIRDTYYITENAAYRLDEFLVNCGFELDGEATRQQMIESTPGRQIMVHIKHTASDDGQTVYANVGSTAPVE